MHAQQGHAMAFIFLIRPLLSLAGLNLKVLIHLSLLYVFALELSIIFSQPL
jgi:hypothetical protein